MAKNLALIGIWAIALGLIAWMQFGRSAPPPIPPAALPPLAAPTSAGDPAYGKALFVAKGCVSCHSHSAFTAAPESFGPNLSAYQPDPAYLRRWLADPAAIKPATLMPKLNLSGEEIEALIAFLQQ